MTERPSSLFEKLKARGEEVVNQISGELMNNPHFLKAMQAAMQGKHRLDGAVGQALKQMNIPTRSEFKKAVRRIEALEQELAALKAAAANPPARRRSPPKAKAE